MIPVLLTKLKTRDGIVLDGIVVLPKRRSNTALIWLHGLGSRFSSGQTLIKELSQECRKNGIGYFKFNNRGHDIVNRDGRGKKRLQGAGLEKFENCVLDIRTFDYNTRKRLCSIGARLKDLNQFFCRTIRVFISRPDYNRRVYADTF